MKKIISLLFLSFMLVSCDPGYCMLISNRTKYDKGIQLKAFTNPVEYHTNHSNIFKTGKLIRKDSLSSTGEFTSLFIPSGQTVKIKGAGIAVPRGEAIILNNMDTVYAKDFKPKGGFFSLVKWAYPLNE